MLIPWLCWMSLCWNDTSHQFEGDTSSKNPFCQLNKFVKQQFYHQYFANPNILSTEQVVVGPNIGSTCARQLYERNLLHVFDIQSLSMSCRVSKVLFDKVLWQRPVLSTSWLAFVLSPCVCLTCSTTYSKANRNSVVTRKPHTKHSNKSIKRNQILLICFWELILKYITV